MNKLNYIDQFADDLAKAILIAKDKKLWYILHYRKPVISDRQSASRLLGNHEKRRVRRTYLPNEIFVSTVFLCLDHQYGNGPPLLFETAIYRDGGFNVITRCSTWCEALKMHWAAVNQIKFSIPDHIL